MKMSWSSNEHEINTENIEKNESTKFGSKFLSIFSVLHSKLIYFHEQVASITFCSLCQ